MANTASILFIACGTHSVGEVSLDALPPELVAEIVVHLPILHRSAALLSLALTCRCLCDIIIPNLLYQAVWLDGEDRAVQVLSSFNTRLAQDSDHQISHYIHYLAIKSDLSRDQREGSTNSLRKLRTLINAGGLPNLTSISLHFGDGWFWEKIEWEILEGHRELDRSFWNALGQNCPSLTHVHLTGVIEKWGRQWLANSGLFDFKALKGLRIQRTLVNDMGFEASQAELDVLLPITSAIETLELPVSHTNGPFVAGRWMALHYPNLRTFIVSNDQGTDDTMVSQFWERHKGLERIEHLNCDGRSEWFPQISHGFPNLRALKCTFSSAKSLLPHIFSQLVSLTLIETVNAQALYLLRVVTPGGLLPNLRSLGIQLISSSHSSKVKLEGNRWYEDDRGHISEVSKRKALRYFDANYLIILAIAVPSVEELELLGCSDISIDMLVFSLQHFRLLHTLILSGPGNGYANQFIRTSGTWQQFKYISNGDSEVGSYAPQSLEEAMNDLGNGCRTLERIRISHIPGALFELHEEGVKIIREEGGGRVIDLKMKKGWGRLIGREDEW